jgi:hypothetical protein
MAATRLRSKRMNDEMKMSHDAAEQHEHVEASASLAIAHKLLVAAGELWPTNDGRHPGLLLNEGRLCIAVPWDDGYRVVAIHEADYGVDPQVIVGAIDRFFTTFDSQAAPQPAIVSTEQ